MVVEITEVICKGSELLPALPKDSATLNGIGAGMGLLGLPDWMGIAGIALAASAAILAIIYLFGVMFRNQELSAYAKFEVNELFVTAIIIIAIAFMVGRFCEIKVGWIFPESGHKDLNMYSEAMDYFDYNGEAIIGVMITNHFFAMQADMLASTTIFSKPLGLGLVSSPGAGLGAPIKNVLYQATNFLAVVFITNYAQKVVFEFALVGFLKYYLPIGIVMRCFTPTRRIGGTLIAIGIGFLFIYPALTVLTSEVLRETTDNFATDTIGNMGAYAKPVFNITSDKATMNLKDFPKGIVGDYDGNTPKPTNPAPGSPPSPVQEYSTGNLIVNLIKSGTGGAMYMVLILPMMIIGIVIILGLATAFNILLIIHAIKGISKTMGEEIDISSLTRLI